MKTKVLLLLSLAGVLHASPARQDCGETKTFTTTNDCGVEYGGTWIECASGMTAMPTFTAPQCAVAEPSTTNPLITPAPTPRISDSVKVSNTTSTCAPHVICIDYLYWCNGKQVFWGDCFDPCSRDVATKPCPSITGGTVVLPPNTFSPTSYGPMHTRSIPTLPTLNATPAPPREDKPWCEDKPYMCAPEGW